MEIERRKARRIRVIVLSTLLFLLAIMSVPGLYWGLRAKEP